MTLTDYLKARGTCKALTRIEAESFGVPYPLVSGWPVKFGGIEITPKMIDSLRIRIGSAKESTAGKASNALDAVFGDGSPAVRKSTPQAASKTPCVLPAAFHGFRLRSVQRAVPVTAGLPWD